MPRSQRLPVIIAFALAAGLALAVAGALTLSVVSGAAAQPADCVTGLSYCAQECDQRTKPQQPERPQCARACVSNYQRCERIELLRLNTGPTLNQGKAAAPSQ
jgi:hypothetical protein